MDIEQSMEGPDTLSRMGEVRVTARLTNAVDEALARRGMLTPEQVRSCDADALGIDVTEMPLTREGVWRAIRAASGGSDGHQGH